MACFLTSRDVGSRAPLQGPGCFDSAASLTAGSPGLGCSSPGPASERPIRHSHGKTITWLTHARVGITRPAQISIPRSESNAGQHGTRDSPAESAAGRRTGPRSRIICQAGSSPASPSQASIQDCFETSMLHRHIQISATASQEIRAKDKMTKTKDAGNVATVCT